jgi:hypothetical protein
VSEPIFFVNRGRGRAAEGPFDEDQIVRLILIGKILGSALVCQQGRLRFTPISGHPPFARALQQANAGGMPVSTDAPKPKRKPAPPPVKRNRGLLFGAILAFFGFALGAVGIGAYVMFDNGGTPPHAAVPSDTEFLFEIGSLHGAAQSLGAVRALDPKLGGSTKLVDDAAADLSDSFKISKSQASTLVLAASSLGVAARKLATAPEGGLVLTFSTAKPVNALLSSRGFKYAALVSSNGRVYKLADAGHASSSSKSLRVLGALMTPPQPNELVWFETSKVLFLGSPSFALDLARSVSLDAPPLAQNPRFRRAQRDFSDKSDAIAYLDPALLAASSPRLITIVAGDWTKAEPITASLKLVPAGLLVHAVLRLPAAPPAISTTPSRLDPAQPLTVIDRLPRETFAYVAALTKTQLSGVELHQSLLEQIARADAGTAERVNSALTQAEATLQFHFDDVFGSFGDQAALAVVAPADYRLELAMPQQMAGNFAIVYAQALKSEAPARALLAQLKAQLSRFATPAQIQEDATGYALLPSDASMGLAVQVRFIKGYVCVAVGNSALVERSMQALTTGDGTLTSDPAHQAARAALPRDAQLFAWFDAGRVVNSALQNPLLSSRARDFWLDGAALRLTGPERITAAVALSGELRDGAYTYRADTLNLPAFAGLFWGSRAGF